MFMLTVRCLRPEVHQSLREQAAAHRSMEAEARAILEVAVGRDSTDVVAALRRFADEVRPTDEGPATIFPPGGRTGSVRSLLTNPAHDHPRHRCRRRADGEHQPSCGDLMARSGARGDGQ